MIQAAIFDLDGLLIDSEPLWRIAEREVFATVGLDLDEAMARETTGMGLREVVAFRHAQRPWDRPSRDEVGETIRRRLIALVAERGRELPGACAAVRFARARCGRIGLATASDRAIIRAALAALGLEGIFDHVQSADELPHPKPHPLVYLTTAERLGVEPRRCLALEDSLTGLIAAKAARMKAVAVPDPVHRADPRFSIADLVLGSLEELGEDAWQRLAGDSRCAL